MFVFRNILQTCLMTSDLLIVFYLIKFDYWHVDVRGRFLLYVTHEQLHVDSRGCEGDHPAIWRSVLYMHV